MWPRNLDPKLTGLGGRDQVDGEEMLEQVHPLLGDIGEEGVFNRLSGNVLDVEHASLTVTALLAKRRTTVLKAGEGNAQVD